MRLEKFNVAEFAAVLRSCAGNVCMITADGDCINSKSLLCTVIGLANLFKVAENQTVSIECENSEDRRKIENYLASAQAAI